MNILRWPSKMPETDTGRLPQGPEAYGVGSGKVCDPRCSCERTLHISLFFDGTNNNDDIKNPWRDLKNESHTNVARLFGAAIDQPERDTYKYYIAGVGTIFPELGEDTYSSMGKAFAAGFGKRCVWGYTRVLNALHRAIMREIPGTLIDDATARRICEALDAGRSSKDLKQREHVVAVAQQNRKDDGQYNRVVKKAWINVFGFSRGAAAARVFVNKLLKEWAPGGRIAGSIPYEVNFVGLFDTVASVGPPDTVTALFPFDKFDGHFAWASGGRLNIPPEVRRCVHFFAIHEQRMSFPLDTIRMGGGYPGGPARWLEVAYPGVHSDVGGGYVPREQGKARLGDQDKLSRIPLHDMYIEALKAGVPLFLEEAIWKSERLQVDFQITPNVAKAFNAWLDRVIPINTVEDAMEYGTRQNLLWRTLRARIGTPDYVSNRPFFAASPQDRMTPNQVRLKHRSLQQSDETLQRLRREDAQLNAELSKVEHRMMDANAAGDINSLVADLNKKTRLDEKIAAKRREIRARHEFLYAVAAGKKPDDARPGEGADEIVANDQTDLLEAAEEFRLLLAFLHEDQRRAWQVRRARVQRSPLSDALAVTLFWPEDQPYVAHDLATEQENRPWLCVERERRPATDTSVVLMLRPDPRATTASIRSYSPQDDVLLEPVPQMVAYLRKWTSTAAVNHFALHERAAIALFDDYIHDSRAWFRVPHFHEYAPGGYGWARTLFVGNDDRVRHLGFMKEPERRQAVGSAWPGA